MLVFRTWAVTVPNIAPDAAQMSRAVKKGNRMGVFIISDIQKLPVTAKVHARVARCMLALLGASGRIGNRTGCALLR